MNLFACSPSRSTRGAAWALAALLLVLCLPGRATAADPTVTQTREVAAFQGLTLSTRAMVVIRQGAQQAVLVEAGEQVVPLISTRVEKDSLVVEDLRAYKTPARVTITVRDLRSLAMGESVTVVAEGLNLPALSLTMGGSSNLILKAVAVRKLDAALGGSSAVKADGQVDELSAALGGSSALHASALETRAVSLTAGGSARAVVWALNSLSVAAGGSSRVGYYSDTNGSVSSGASATVQRLGAAPPKPQ
jgi:Putative auto-transporter adhesin, head GIN domain